jgi:hypothetical protein
MVAEIKQAFAAIGAELVIETAGNAFEIDVRQSVSGEAFYMQYPWSDVITAEALDVKPIHRHLVLDVSGWRLPISGRFLCGHDEQHWFVASVPFDRRTATVRGAIEALKPDLVKRAQKRLGVKHRLHRRKTAAYVRQGEWFFLPRPMMHVGDRAIRGGELTREGGGKPHFVEWLYRPEGNGETFVRGAVSHQDHATIYLHVWHRVVQNMEARPKPVAENLTRMMYLD